MHPMKIEKATAVARDLAELIEPEPTAQTLEYAKMLVFIALYQSAQGRTLAISGFKPKFGEFIDF